MPSSSYILSRISLLFCKKNIIASAEILEGGKFFNWTAWKYFSEQK